MPPQETQDTITALHRKARELTRLGMPEHLVIEELKKEGIDADYAALIIENVHNDASDKKNFWKLIVGGFFLVLAGLALNLLSYRIPLQTGSFFYYIFWGIMVAGVLLIIKAFTIFKK